MAAKKPAKKASATPPIDEIWFSRLDEAWKKVFADQCGVDSPKKLKKLGSITSLYIDDEAEVTSLAPLEKLQKIKEINCDAKKVTDLAPLTKLPKLENLRISSPITDFAPIAKMLALTDLDVSDTAIADLSVVTPLAKLERLDVSGTGVTDLSPLAKLKKLERLELARTKVRDLAPITSLGKLKSLVVAFCPIESFEPLAKIPHLGTLDASGTTLESLEPIHGQKGLYILQVRETKVSFEALLRFKSKGAGDTMIGLDIYSDFMEHEPFLAALEGLRSVQGLEEAVTAWANNVLVAMVKSDDEDVLLAPRLLQAFLRLEVAPNKYTKEIAGNALHVIVTQKVSAELDRAVLDRLVPQAEMDRRLAFNLACYHARRGNKPDALRFAKLALEKGQEAVRFRADADFESLRGDAEFEAIVSAVHTPDPYSAPLAWWKSLPEDLRESFYFDEDPTEDAIRQALAEPLERFQLDGVRSMDPLRGLRVKSLLNRECKASSLDIVGTFRDLEEIDWEKNEYLGGTQLSDLSPLAGVTSLRIIKMPGHLFTTLDPLAGLVNLEELNVRGSPIASIEGVRRLVKLTDLAIDAKEPIDLSALENLEALEDLWLHGPVKSFEPIAKLKSLRRLWMQKATLADGSPVPLAPLHGLSKLEQIWVGNERAPQAKKELKKPLPKCKVS